MVRDARVWEVPQLMQALTRNRRRSVIFACTLDAETHCCMVTRWGEGRPDYWMLTQPSSKVPRKLAERKERGARKRVWRRSLYRFKVTRRSEGFDTIAPRRQCAIDKGVGGSFVAGLFMLSYLVSEH